MKQKPRKFKGWANVPVGVLVTAVGNLEKERDRALLKLSKDQYAIKFIDEPDDIFEFDDAEPDHFTTEKYREVLL